jgi:murein DD-endopeptidase MepM/ murein hydrolase activator NlpD
MISLPGTSFTAHLARENGLEEHGLVAWAMVPGMAFGSTDRWWGDRGRRERPHEGVDLCLYRDRLGQVCRLGEHARLPAMYDGTVVRLCDDFLGRSVMMEHDLPAGARLYTMYGHTVPRPDLRVGQAVRAGEIVAGLAPLPPHKADILPHLHISLGWASGAVPHDQLDWETIPGILTLVDPAQVLDWPLMELQMDCAQGCAHEQD